MHICEIETIYNIEILGILLLTRFKNVCIIYFSTYHIAVDLLFISN